MRSLWLMVTSDDARHKAFNFLKLIKPPDGTEMTDQVIKLDWNKDTSDKWTQNDAKISMSKAGLDWEKRDPGQPLGEDNFRVIYLTSHTQALSYDREIEVPAGEPVRHFELLEEWMGPALGVSEPSSPREGFGWDEKPPGSAYNKFPPSETFNTLTWVNVWVSDPLESSDFWFRTTVQKVKDTAASSNKVSQNGHGDSVWWRWTNVQDPDLATDEIWLFGETSTGETSPLVERLVLAV